MSKRRTSIRDVPGAEPSLDHASELLQEYTAKLRTSARRVREVNEKFLALVEQRLKEPPFGNQDRTSSDLQQRYWFALQDNCRLQYDEHARHLHALVPQAKKLAQHISQIITHGTNDTVVKIELGLRVAELESAIETAKAVSNIGHFFHF